MGLWGRERTVIHLLYPVRSITYFKTRENDEKKKIPSSSKKHNSVSIILVTNTTKQVAPYMVPITSHSSASAASNID